MKSSLWTGANHRGPPPIGIYWSQVIDGILDSSQSESNGTPDISYGLVVDCYDSVKQVEASKTAPTARRGTHLSLQVHQLPCPPWFMTHTPSTGSLQPEVVGFHHWHAPKIRRQKKSVVGAFIPPLSSLPGLRLTLVRKMRNTRYEKHSEIG